MFNQFIGFSPWGAIKYSIASCRCSWPYCYFVKYWLIQLLSILTAKFPLQTSSCMLGCVSAPSGDNNSSSSCPHLCGGGEPSSIWCVLQHSLVSKGQISGPLIFLRDPVLTAYCCSVWVYSVWKVLELLWRAGLALTISWLCNWSNASWKQQLLVSATVQIA